MVGTSQQEATATRLVNRPPTRKVNTVKLLRRIA
jgi:hypothetical protein